MKTKRPMALCLCLMMVMSLMPLAAIAAEDEADIVAEAQETVIEETTVEEPAVEAPADDTSAAEESAIEEPVEESASEEPAEELPIEEPAIEEPASEEPASEEPIEEAAEQFSPDGAFEVPYVDENGVTQIRSSSDLTLIAYSSDPEYVLESGWYYTYGQAEYNTLVIHGTVNIIVSDGTSLTANCGIVVTQGNTLNIYCGPGGTGRLIATGGNDHAGIGGIKEDVYTEVKAGLYGQFVRTVHSYNYLPCGTVRIYGGIITATGHGNAAGIGGYYCSAGGTIEINGGTVTAIGDSLAAGIGGGYEGDGGSVTINGGTVTATGGAYAAGIGGGYEGAGGNVTINGGTVTATGDFRGTGIGGGYGGSGVDVTINGGTVTATGGLYGKGIGDGGLWLDDSLALYGGDSADPTSLIEAVNGDYVRYRYMAVKPAPAPVPEFRTHSLVLSGEIGINFFMYLPEGIDYSDSEMTFIYGDAQARDAFDPDDRDLNGNGYYGFTCYVSSIEMAEPITAIFSYGDGKAIEQTYSVKDYITAYEAVAGSFDDATTALVHALADYGHCVQPVLAEANGWTIGVDYAAMDTYYTDSFDYDAVASAVSPYTLRRDTGDSDIETIHFTLNLLSRTELRVLLTPKAGYTGKINVTVDGASYTPKKQEDGRYLISISNVPAHELGDSHEIVVTTDSGTATVTASAMSYVNAVTGPDQPANIRSAAAALYCYYKAAMDYRAANA